jgi:SAM-dependent methyltransferase
VTVDRWAGAAEYEAYIGRWSRPVAATFLDWLSIAPGQRWVDVGCGTGALCGAILERTNPVSVVGVDPSADFVELARRRVADLRARFAVAFAVDLPLEAGSADVIVSGLVLNFVPDLAAALAEMRRVDLPGGTIAGYVWDLAGRMDIIRTFWDAAIALDPAAREKDEGARFPLCAPDPLRGAFEDAGLTEVSVRSIDVPTVFRDFDDYWTPFLGGVGPAPAYLVELDEASRTALRERLRATLPIQPDGTVHLIARAWAVRGGNG